MGRRERKKLAKTLEQQLACKALWYYVLAEGLQLAARGDLEECRWIYRDDRHVGSFVYCCAVINADPDVLRSYLDKARNTNEAAAPYPPIGRALELFYDLEAERERIRRSA